MSEDKGASLRDRAVVNGAGQAVSTADAASIPCAWQDIATAPKDGTRVDLWGIEHLTYDKRGARKVNCCWGPVQDYWRRERDDWQGAGGEDFEPTHWMPLPAPPVSA